MTNCSYIIGIITWLPPKTKLPKRYVFSKRFSGFRLGRLFFRAHSLLTPAIKKMAANSQILVHFIFCGGSSFCGMRLLLRVVTKPPKTIRIGNIHGVLKSIYVAMAPTNMMTVVIVLWTEILNVLNAA